MSCIKKGKLTDDFFKLFVKREWKVILGKKWSNLWLLAGMLTATFLAIAFSNASMRYLSDKMNDPFIKWVDIRNSYGEGDFSGLEYALNEYENQEKFDYNSYQSDYYFTFEFFGADRNSLDYFQCRFFENFQTALVEKILDEDNIVDNCRIEDLYSLPEESIGIILTEKALHRLGYEKAPAYINLCSHSIGADSLGFYLYDGIFARAPIPVLGVVKRLPSNVDMISTKYLFVQEGNSDSYPFSMGSNRSYSESLRYFIPENEDRDAFIAELKAKGEKISTVDCFVDEYSFYKPEIIPFAKGSYVSLVGINEMPLVPLETSLIDEQIMAQWSDKGIVRVFDYNFSPFDVSLKSYLSVHFNTLNHIKDFETFVSEFDVKIDMSQINSKENYNAVSIMANVLSWAIIVFAIVCIILFLVDLLKSYFQKIKRNIGTFKAFGVSNKRLTSVYCLIVASTIIAAIFMALAITFLLQESFAVFGLLKEGEYNYLALGSFKTLAAALIITISSVYTVYLVMANLLKHTPGDLIYDR